MKFFINLMRIIKITVVNIFSIFLLFEILSIIYIYIFNYTNPPRFFYNNTHIEDNNPFFGVWHKFNGQFNHKRECFDVVYNFNSYGARDKERSQKSKYPRGIILGDSFIEGFGLEDDSRISNILEEKIGREILNFGTSGNFGTTQMALLYENLAAKFDHEFLIIGLFPHNDFDDNSIEVGHSKYPSRYRPYRIINKESGSYELIYFLKDLKNSYWYPDNIKKSYLKFLSIFKRMTHTGTVLSTLKNKIMDKPDIKFRFAEYSNKEFDIIKYDLLNIFDKSEGKSIFVFAIPSSFDFNYALNGKLNFNKLGNELKKFCNKNNMEYIDIFSKLLESYNSKNFNNLYLSCDGHFSKEGNTKSAEIIYKYIKSSTLLNN